MPNVTQLGPRIYSHPMEYPTTKFPVVDVGQTQEIDWPFRTGKGLVLRLPFTRRALVVGVWTGKQDETSALTNAIGARSIDHVG
jgi:hypothetical protein